MHSGPEQVSLAKGYREAPAHTRILIQIAVHHLASSVHERSDDANIGQPALHQLDVSINVHAESAEGGAAKQVSVNLLEVSLCLGRDILHLEDASEVCGGSHLIY